MPLSTVLFHLNKMAAIGLLNSGPGGFAHILIQHLESDSLLKEPGYDKSSSWIIILIIIFVNSL